MVYFPMPRASFIKRAIKGAAKKVDRGERFISANMTAMVGRELPNIVGAAALAAQGKKAAAVGNLAGGKLGQVAADTTSRAVRTSQRAARRFGAKAGVVGAVRGARTGLMQNRRTLMDAATGGYGMTLGEQANNIVRNSRFGQTRVGKALTTDISTPIARRLQLRQRARQFSGGLFSRY
jgi:hypothetical protein